MLPQDGYPLGAIPCAPGDPGPVIVLEAMPPFPGQPWSPVACAADAGSIRDELIWHAGRSEPGTAWRRRRGSAERLLAVTGRHGVAVRPPSPPVLMTSWTRLWFGRSAGAAELLLCCDRVDAHAAAAAACGVAAAAAHLLPPGGAAAAALERASAWAAGRAEKRPAASTIRDALREVEALGGGAGAGGDAEDDERAWVRSAVLSAAGAAGFAAGSYDCPSLFSVGLYAADALARSSGPTATHGACGARLAEEVRRVVPFGEVLLSRLDSGP